MYYKEFLRARNTVFVYTLVLAIAWMVITIISLAAPMTEVTVDSQKVTTAKHAASLAPLAWPALFALAAFFASIVSTVLGSTLSQENDGHLELAFTKPHSRAAYATTTMAVDVAAILVSIFVAFALIMLHVVIFHPSTQLVSGPDPFSNALRFLLFPIAWYAIIVGLSAGLRGKASVVQGLIWPVSLGLAALREIPSAGAWQPWHNLCVVINAFNPLIYTAYQDRTSDTNIQIVGAAGLPALLSATVLIAFLIAGWAGAVWQWRRVEG